VFTGETITAAQHEAGAALRAAEVFRSFPVALLLAE
jgi:hypothetical protein